MADDFLRVNVGGGKQLVHKRTGKPIHMVREFDYNLPVPCEECGEIHMCPIYKYRPDKRYSAKNIVERIIPPARMLIPLYD